jgi:hypothetical protein
MFHPYFMLRRSKGMELRSYSYVAASRSCQSEKRGLVLSIVSRLFQQSGGKRLAKILRIWQSEKVWRSVQPIIPHGLIRTAVRTRLRPCPSSL